MSKLLTPTRLISEHTAKEMVDRVEAMANIISSAFNGVVEYSARIDELAQVGRFVPADILSPRFDYLSQNLSKAKQAFDNRVAELHAPLHPAYLQYLKALTDAIQSGVQDVLASNCDDLQPLRQLFIQHPVNNWFAPVVDEKQMGRPSNKMTDWRVWILDEWKKLEANKPKPSPTKIIKYLLVQLGAFDVKAQAYKQRDDLDDQERKAFNSLNAGLANPSDYRYRLMRDKNKIIST